MQVPQPGEYNPRFDKYISLAMKPGIHFSEIIKQNTLDVAGFFSSVPSDKYDFRYAENKWSIKEVLMHINDTERVFAYRALVCARGDADTPLHYMDENLYAANVSVDKRSMESLFQEFVAIRASNSFLFDNITEEQSKLLGNNIEYKLSARAIAYAMVGHTIHHINVLEERYL